MSNIGELVAAAVVDSRVWDAYGATANDGIYLVGQPGPALPFVLFRAWKVPTGFVSEEIRLIGPSGRTIFRWGPEPRRMAGAMDLTTEVDTVDDAVFDETGTFVASFMLNGEIVGEIEVPVYVQASPTKLSKETEDGLKKSDVIWVGTESPNGHRRTVPGLVRVQERQDLRLVAEGARCGRTDDPRRARCRPAAGDHPSEAARHRARGVLRGAAEARGPGVGGSGEAPGRQAEEPRRGPRGVAHPLAEHGRHRRAHARRRGVTTLSG